MNGKIPPDWVLLEAARLADFSEDGLKTLRMRYGSYVWQSFSALCDMIEKHEQPPVNRKFLCAEEAVKLTTSWSMRDAAIRAIELWEKGFGL